MTSSDPDDIGAILDWRAEVMPDEPLTPEQQARVREWLGQQKD